jgi:hypothetical protein
MDTVFSRLRQHSNSALSAAAVACTAGPCNCTAHYCRTTWKSMSSADSWLLSLYRPVLYVVPCS